MLQRFCRCCKCLYNNPIVSSVGLHHILITFESHHNLSHPHRRFSHPYGSQLMTLRLVLLQILSLIVPVCKSGQTLFPQKFQSPQSFFVWNRMCFPIFHLCSLFSIHFLVIVVQYNLHLFSVFKIRGQNGKSLLSITVVRRESVLDVMAFNRS